MNVRKTLQKAINHHNNNNLNKAEQLYINILNKEPNNPDANHNLGIIALQMNKPQDALPFLKKALQIIPTNSQFQQSLAHAKALMQESIIPHTQNLDNQLTELFEQKMYSKCLNMAKAAIQKNPKYSFGWKVIGTINMIQEDYKTSLINLNKALELDPKDIHTIKNIGNVFKKLYQYEEAEQYFLKAIALEHDFAEAYFNLGVLLKDSGKFEESVQYFQKAIDIKYDYIDAYTHLLFTLNYLESLLSESLLNKSKQYGKMITSRATSKFTSWHKNLESKKLRIGFVSGDLRNHPVGFFCEGLFKYLDKKKFDLFAFPTVATSDDLTQRIKPFFQEWIPIHDKKHYPAATIIHDKEIDILIDLSGHTEHNRLPVFSYKPAPVQITWLGYFATTGLPEMDYILGDPHSTPKNEQHHFTEKIWNLPETRLCFTPPKESILTSLLPAKKNGYITFGNFSDLMKINDQVLKIWAAILERVPNSKLFLRTKQFSNLSIIKNVQTKFLEYGILDNRLILKGSVSRNEYLKTYNQIDIILDTFPYPGGTTSCEALWMGVPIVTLQGNNLLSHQGESIVYNAGLSNWIAKDHTEYIEKAISFASDIESLSTVHLELKKKVLKTPLFDNKLFAKHFEEALIKIFESS